MVLFIYYDFVHTGVKSFRRKEERKNGLKMCCRNNFKLIPSPLNVLKRNLLSDALAPSSHLYLVHNYFPNFSQVKKMITSILHYLKRKELPKMTVVQVVKPLTADVSCRW